MSEKPSIESLLSEKQLIARNKAKERAKANYLKNQEIIKTRSKDRYEAKREEILERQLEYNKAHADKYLQYSRLYYSRNKEQIRERNLAKKTKTQAAENPKVEKITKVSTLCEYCQIDIKPANVRQHEISNKHLKNKLTAMNSV
jgi:hypothetical protein